MKITKTTQGNATVYYYDGVKVYEHYLSPYGFESWSEFKDGEQIRYRNSDGDEIWSVNNPENPENWIEEKTSSHLSFAIKL